MKREKWSPAYAKFWAMRTTKFGVTVWHLGKAIAPVLFRAMDRLRSCDQRPQDRVARLTFT